MRVLVVLAGLLALTSALSEYNNCGPVAALKVKAQWAEVYGHTSKPRELLGHEIFDNMFDHAPKARELFTRVRGDNIYSPEFDAHMMRVLGGLDTAISVLPEEELLKAQLAHLNVQHKDMAIPAEYWPVFEHAFWHSIPLHVGEVHFDQDAWHGCMDKIIKGITATAPETT